MVTEMIVYAVIVMFISFVLGGYACYDYAFERGKREGHREAYAWSQKWGDLEQ